MKIWLDDIRDAPDETWTVLRQPWGLLHLVSQSDPGDIETISFDHDLAAYASNGDEITGAVVLRRLEELAFKFPEMLNRIPSDLRIHSANPVGRKNMQAAIDSIERMRSNAV